jgi:hypothetical protein
VPQGPVRVHLCACRCSSAQGLHVAPPDPCAVQRLRRPGQPRHCTAHQIGSMYMQGS